MVEYLLVLVENLVLLEPGQAMQSQVQDGLGLHLGQMITVLLESVLRVEVIRPG